MEVLVEAKGSKRDGTAYFPYESKQRVPVEVVDRRWLEQRWKYIKRSHVENKRLASLQQLRQAVDGKSSSLEAAADAVTNLSEPVRKLMEEIAAEYAAGGFQPPTPGIIWYPPPPNPAEVASEFMFSLRREPRALLAAEMTQGLSRVKLCQWLDKNEQRQYGLFCPDMLSAIYAVVAEGFGIAACLRCGGLFLRDRADKQFCSPRCQNTYLTAKRRRRKRDLSAARKRSKRQVSRVARKRRERAA